MQSGLVQDTQNIHHVQTSVSFSLQRELALVTHTTGSPMTVLSYENKTKIFPSPFSSGKGPYEVDPLILKRQSRTSSKCHKVYKRQDLRPCSTHSRTGECRCDAQNRDSRHNSMWNFDIFDINISFDYCLRAGMI